MGIRPRRHEEETSRGNAAPLFSQGGQQSLVDLAGRFFLPERQHMGVGVQCDLDGGVPEPLGDDLGMHAGLQ